MTDIAGQYLSHVFFACNADADRDMFATLYQQDDPGKWCLDFRVRVYAGTNDPHDGSDAKTHWQATFVGDEDTVVDRVRGVFEGAARVGGCSDVDIVPIRSSDPRVAMKALGGKKWAHFKIGPADGT